MRLVFLSGGSCQALGFRSCGGRMRWIIRSAGVRFGFIGDRSPPCRRFSRRRHDRSNRRRVLPFRRPAILNRAGVIGVQPSKPLRGRRGRSLSARLRLRGLKVIRNLAVHARLCGSGLKSGVGVSRITSGMLHAPCLRRVLIVGILFLRE